MNLIEYLRLLDHYEIIKNTYHGGENLSNQDLEELRDKVLFDIRLKREFEAWFRTNGYQIPLAN
jgi:hypothetical protein